MRGWTRPIFGPFRRKAHTGVPADHFPPAREMFTRYGDGRTVLVADGPAPGDDQDDNPAVVAQALDAVIDSIEEAMANGDTAQAADLIAAADVIVDKLIMMLGGVDSDELGEPAEMRARLEQMGTVEFVPELLEQIGGYDEGLNARLARLQDQREAVDGLALHEPYTGVHSHEHFHRGKPHTHSHFHGGGASHNHSHSAAQMAIDIAPPAEPELEGTPEAEPISASTLSHLSESERRRVDGANEITDPSALAALVASSFESRGGLEAWAALREKQGLTAATNADGTITPAAWHSYLCIEGIRTDDGRELMKEACRFPDLPVSMRLLVEDEGGHWGAVTCGRIDTMERQPYLGSDDYNAIYSEGLFGSDPNGQLAELMVEEQTQRFVSIDPRDASGQLIQIRIEVGNGYDEDDGVYDCWMRITDCVVGAATIVAMPAIQQAVITLADRPLPDAPIATAAAPPGLPDDLDPGAIAASAAPDARPPASWFDHPGFGNGSDSPFDARGDARLVLQADHKSYACPLTVEDPDPTYGGLRRVYGHFAWWECEHTGFPGQKVKPPHSKSGYAFYNLGPGVECADGSKVTGIGTVTMGCGHAPMTKVVGTRQVKLSPQEAQAHYDGGYGAVQVGKVRAGEDAFGPWVAGYVPPEVSDEDVRKFLTLNLSGDWREITDNLEAIAVLAVPVPGFPVRRELTAAGTPNVIDGDFQAGVSGDNGRIYALVAAGMVRRVTDAERISFLEQTLTTFAGRLADVDGRVSGMQRRQARERAGL